MAERKRLRRGDRVSWASHSGRAHGVVQEEITERTRLGRQTVNAAVDDPQYRIRDDRSGKDVHHRPEVLRDEW